MIIYPDKPWVDGQEFQHTTADGNTLTGRYYADKNTWAFRPYTDNDLVYTNTVYTVDIKPAESSIARAGQLFDSALPLPVPQVDNLVTQQDVNWYLYGLISNVEGSSAVWIDAEEPPKGDAGEPLFFFWYKTDEDEMYVWDILNKEWKLTGLMEFDRPPIISSDEPTEHPKFPDQPLEEGDFWYNSETGQLKTYSDSQWNNAGNNPDLETVLTNGNVADKGILLTDAEDAFIALAPDEATIDIASDTEKKNPRLRLTHIDELNFPNAQAQIELDQNGTRVDFEFFQDIDECHFRFDNEEKFVLNRDGDAQFIGKVEGEPGTQNNEFVTFGQLTTLEEEIEQLAPSLERGTWNFTLNNPPGPGEYTMIQILSEEEQATKCTEAYLQCLADANGDAFAQSECNKTQVTCTNAIDGDVALTTANWSECEQLIFNSQDSKGVTHEWAGIDSDHYIDVFNETDDGFMVGDITTHGGGSFAFDLVSSRGTANGLASVKIFKTQGTVDFDQYVRKSGDTMTGTLIVEANATSKFTGKTSSLACYGGPDASDGTYVFYVYSAPYPKPDGEEGETKRDLLFGVVNDGRLFGKANHVPTSPFQLANKQYVDDQDNKAVSKSGTNTVENNFKIKTDSKTFISIGDDALKLYNVADPTEAAWAANKRYVDQAVAAAQKYSRAPAALSWKFDSVTSGDDKPDDNSFRITTNNGTKYLRLDFKTANGVDLGDALWADTRVTIDSGPVGTIWYTAGSDPVWRLKEQFRVNAYRWNYNDHFEFKLSSRHGNQTYTDGVSYFITVGGFF